MANGSVVVIRDAFGIPGWYKGEHEFLLAPGSKFMITDIYRVDWQQHGGLVENLTVFEVSMVANENKLHFLN